MSLEELRKALKEKNLTFGSKETIRNLRLGKIKAVLIASNCSKPIKETLQRYTKLNNVKVIELKQPSNELSLLCKRGHSVSVISY